MPSMLEELSPGTVVAGRYVVERRGRRRPLANVYTAHAEGRSDGQFHVWQLKGVRVVDAESGQRFIQAMERVRALSTPSIPLVVDEELLATGPVIVTERTPLPTLRERIAGGLRLQRPDVIHLVRAVAAVVDELHGCEPPIVHRALSPDDIVLGDHEGQCWVECCGFVHAITISGMAESPTPSFVEVPYRSPDELNHTVEPRTDLFALASIVFECLTGERAFQGDDAAAVDDAIRRGARPSVCSLRPELSPEVDPILLRAWTTDFVNGYATAWSFARDLTEALSAVPSARVRPRRANRPTAPALSTHARPSLADAPDESSMVMPAPDLRARAPAALPDEAELDDAFDALLGPGASAPRPVLSIPAPQISDDDGDRPTEVISESRIPKERSHRDTGDHASRLAPGPPVRAPTPGRGMRAPPANPGILRPATRPSVHVLAAVDEPTRTRSVHPPSMDPAHGGPVRRSVYPSPASPSPTIEPGSRSVVRSPTPVGNSVRATTPVPLPRTEGGSPQRTIATAPLPRTMTQPPPRVPQASLSQPPRIEQPSVRPSLRAPPSGGSIPPPEAPLGFPHADRPPVKIITTPPVEPRRAAPRRGLQTRAAAILGIAIVVAVTIFVIGQYQIARVERDTARPGVFLPVRSSGNNREALDSLPAGRTPGGASTDAPDQADLSAVRGRLESVVRLCLAHGASVRTIHVLVRYLGVSGHAIDVHMAGPFARDPSAACVDRAARTIDLPAFGARDYTVDYSFNLE